MKKDCHEIGFRREDGAVLTLLDIADLFPFFLNPVKWCSPSKLMQYKKLIEEGVEFSPIVVCRENERLVVYDGHHRWLASYLAGREKIYAWVDE